MAKRDFAAPIAEPTLPESFWKLSEDVMDPHSEAVLAAAMFTVSLARLYAAES